MGRRKKKNKVKTSILYQETPSMEDFDLDNFQLNIEKLMADQLAKNKIIETKSDDTDEVENIIKTSKKFEVSKKILASLKGTYDTSILVLKYLSSLFKREFVRMTAFSVIFTFIVTLTASSSFFIYRELHDSREIQARKMFHMENAFNKFRNIKPYELNTSWINVLNKKKEVDKKLIYNAIDVIFSHYGGSLGCTDAEVAKKLDAFLEVQLTKIVVDYRMIKPGDFLVFRPKWNNGKQFNRVCLIEEYINGVIKYLDYDNQLGTLSYSINQNDYSIEKVVECSFPVWVGVNIHKGIYITRGMKIDHEGVDMLIASNNRSVLSFTDGEVVTAFSNYNHNQRWEGPNRGGNYCVVKTTIYGETRYLQYLHLKNMNVKKDAKVKKGDYLGEYADLGNSTGPHLHLAMYESMDKFGYLQKPRDPLPLLFANSAFILYNKYFNYEEIVQISQV